MERQDVILLQGYIHCGSYLRQEISVYPLNSLKAIFHIKSVSFFWSGFGTFGVNKICVISVS